MAWHPFRNLGLKTAAVGLSTLLWFTVSGQQVERSISVPVLYARLPAGLQMTGYRFEQVNVHLRGGLTQMSQLGREEVKLVIDLADAQPGQKVLTLRPEQVQGAPLGIEVTQVDPQTLTVTLEQSGAASLSVVPDITGQPAPGFAIGSVTVEPSKVMVSGPVNRLRATAALATEAVSVDGASTAVIRTVDLSLDDPELRLVDVRAVKVTVAIVRKAGGQPQP